jgi:hypothetical protein
MEAALGKHAARDIKELAPPLFGGEASRHFERDQTLDFSGIA